MRIHRFYFIPEKDLLEEIAPFGVTITDPDLIHQWSKVMRYSTGDKVQLFDGTGFEYPGVIESIEKDRAYVRVTEKSVSEVSFRTNVMLFIAVTKRDTFEWLVQKATELGVQKIVPLRTHRTIKQNISKERLRKIAIEAAEQSGRSTIPEIHDPEDVASIFTSWSIPFIAFDMNGQSYKLLRNEDFNDVGVLIGPEGGWDSEEFTKFKESGVSLYSFGKQTLRAETAAIIAVSIFTL